MVERNIDVTLGTTNANSGVVHAGYVPSVGQLRAKFVDEGNRLIDELSRPLNFTYKRCGALVVSRSAEEDEQLKSLFSFTEK